MTTPAPVDQVRAVLAIAVAGQPLDGADGRHVDRYRAAAQRFLVDEGCLTPAGEITDMGRRMHAMLGGRADA